MYISLRPLLELVVQALELVAHQRVRVHDHLVLLNLQDHKARYRLSHQAAEGPGHRPRVYKIYIVVARELKLV